MPTYDYECEVCGHTFEKFQPITARPIRLCPACGRRKARRLLGTGAGVIFRGSGFYQTDYRSESYKKAAEKDKQGTGPGQEGKSSDGGSEKKPTTDSSGGKKAETKRTVGKKE